MTGARLRSKIFQRKHFPLFWYLTNREVGHAYRSVCKMEVAIADAAASHDYHSETLYFCSLDCQRKFERERGIYMNEMDDEDRIAS